MFWHRKPVQGSEDTLRTLNGRIDDLEAALRRIKVEWEDVLDRFERLMGRLNKRTQRDRPAAEPEAPVNDRSVVPQGYPDVVAIRRSGSRGPTGMGT